MYDEDDEMINAVCGCVYCLEPLMSESDDPFMCLLSDESREEQVYAITFEEDVDECDDEVIANKSRSLRDVDGWQRRDPWAGNSASIPKRVSMTSAPTHYIYYLVYVFLSTYFGCSGHTRSFSIF